MSNVAIFGNSHLACVKKAADRDPRVAEDQGVVFDFFGVGGHGIRDFQATADELVPVSDELRSAMRRLYGEEKIVKTSNYDYFVIVGGQFGFRNVLPFYRQWGVLNHRQYRQDVGLVSEGCRDDALRAVLESSNAIRLLLEIRKATARPVIMVSAPFRCDRALETKDDSVFLPYIATGYMTTIYNEFKDVASMLAHEYKFINCWQNESTYNVPGFSLRKFSKNGIGFDSHVPEKGDLSHKNLTFGRLTLLDIIEEIRRLEG